ncbi:neurotrypsin-like [Argonauta hians]
MAIPVSVNFCFLLVLPIMSAWAGINNTGNIRLAGGSDTYGRVELRKGDEWGTICDDGWDDSDAAVVCKMLGLSGGTAFPGAWFSKGVGPILMSDVNCIGEELSVWDCDHIDQHYCSHREDASVVCDNISNKNSSSSSSSSSSSTTTTRPWIISSGSGKIQLVGENSRSYGRVEVLHAGRWGTICDDWWDVRNANVVCRMLGFSSGETYRPQPGHGPIWLDDVKCKGNEDDLLDCFFSAWGDHNCFHYEDAGVKCF